MGKAVTLKLVIISSISKIQNCKEYMKHETIPETVKM